MEDLSSYFEEINFEREEILEAFELLPPLEFQLDEELNMEITKQAVEWITMSVWEAHHLWRTKTTNDQRKTYRNESKH